MAKKIQTPEEYFAWLQKFDKKFTTDETFTPPAVYQVVQDWVCRRYALNPETIIRPFYPGGDYQNEDYSDRVVLDNPPFSIISKIVKYYESEGVSYFLFCPYLSSFSLLNLGNVSVIAQNHKIAYTNAAQVPTSFATNLEKERKIITAPELQVAIKLACKTNTPPRTLNIYPPGFYIPSHFSAAAERGERIELPIPANAGINKLNDDAGAKVKVFGSGVQTDGLPEVDKYIPIHVNGRRLHLPKK